MACIARLTNFNTSHWEICPRRVATLVKTCSNKAEPGTHLCERCSRREEGGRALSQAIHGLLTDPIPEYSHIYGGPWFWKWVNKVDANPPEHWVILAEEAQEAAEKFCEEAGFKPWRFTTTQSKETIIEPEMPTKKALPKVKPEDLPAKAKVTSVFKPITKFYNETADEPVKLATDTQKIWKEELDGEIVWRCETGFVFKDLEGKPGKPIGKIVDGDLNRF
jgi:hypothetical protein